jgi:hypothetical protein
VGDQPHLTFIRRPKRASAEGPSETPARDAERARGHTSRYRFAGTTARNLPGIYGWPAAAEGVSRAAGVSCQRNDDNTGAQRLYRKQGYLETGIPPKRIVGTIIVRTGPIEVDDTLLTWEKRLGRGPQVAGQ